MGSGHSEERPRDLRCQVWDEQEKSLGTFSQRDPLEDSTILPPPNTLRRGARQDRELHNSRLSQRHPEG